ANIPEVEDRGVHNRNGGDEGEQVKRKDMRPHGVNHSRVIATPGSDSHKLKPHHAECSLFSPEETSHQPTQPEAEAATPDKPTNQKSRHEELKERAKLLLEQARKDAGLDTPVRSAQKPSEPVSPGSPEKEATKPIPSPSSPTQSNEEKQKRLRERAKLLIEEARASLDQTKGITRQSSTTSEGSQDTDRESVLRKAQPKAKRITSSQLFVMRSVTLDATKSEVPKKLDLKLKRFSVKRTDLVSQLSQDKTPSPQEEVKPVNGRKVITPVSPLSFSGEISIDGSEGSGDTRDSLDFDELMSKRDEVSHKLFLCYEILNVTSCNLFRWM
ncbi:uncharacterized protein, partial [Argopecten irradians]|uniref:uncharacterized protein n=1 Tax=Argopecten irradians TaxID=31199 RepID=UPI003720A512